MRKAAPDPLEALRSAPADRCVRVATYNTHQWVGMDGRRDIDRVLSVIRSLDADLIALQEVLLPWAGFTRRHLARETGLRVIPGRTLYRKDAEYGNALLSALPVREVRLLDLTVPPFEPRGAILASLTLGNLQATVTATHLGMRQRERVRQISRLMPEAGSVEGLSVLLGDINEWNPWSPVMGILRAAFGSQAAPKSFPSRLPVLALDRILVRPPVLDGPPCAIRSGAARAASDHLPLEAGLRVPGSGFEPVRVATALETP